MPDFNMTNLCDADKSCLLVVDMQRRLLAAMPTKIKLIRSVGVLLQAADALSIPVLTTEQYPEGLGPTAPEIAALLPDAAVQFKKTCFSCVGADNFLQSLEKTTRKQIVLTGVEAHVCILQTVIELLAADYQVFVTADGIGSRHRQDYQSSLQRMSRAGAVICRSESILFEWLRDAKHQQFKGLSALIR